MRIAKPRNETSPNFKAFSTANTTNTDDQRKFSSTVFDSELKNKNYTELFTPVDIKNTKNKPKDRDSYFSLGNTFYGTDGKVDLAGRLDNLVHRFSHDFTLGGKLGSGVRERIKRFSDGTGDFDRSKLTNGFGLNRYEAIKERDEYDVNGDVNN